MKWQLQTAKARLSEVIRRAREEGPQTITVRGKEEFVLMRLEDAQQQLNPCASPPRTGLDLFRPLLGIGVDLDQYIGPRVVEEERLLFTGPEWDNGEDDALP